MKITFDIHSKLLGLIGLSGCILLSNYFFQTNITGNWHNKEPLSLFSIIVFIFFMALPFVTMTLFRDFRDFEIDQKELQSMPKYRQILNSPQSIERVYLAFMYFVPLALIMGLLMGNVK